MQTPIDFAWQVYSAFGAIVGLLAALMIAWEEAKDGESTVWRPLVWFCIAFTIWPVLYCSVLLEISDRFRTGDF